MIDDWIYPTEHLPERDQAVLVKVNGNVGLFVYRARHVDVPLRFEADTSFMNGRECEPESFAPHEIDGWMLVPE